MACAKLTYASPQAGDVLLFNPYQLAHKAIVSNKGQKRFVFNACIVPSPVHWQNVLDNHHFPSYNCQSFEGFAPKVLSFLKSPANAQGLITVAAQNRIVSHEHLRFVVLSIFSDREFAEQVAENIRQQDPELKICIDLSTLFNLLKSQLTQSLNKEQLNVDDISKLKELAEFDEKYGNSVRRYMDAEKPNPLVFFGLILSIQNIRAINSICFLTYKRMGLWMPIHLLAPRGVALHLKLPVFFSKKVLIMLLLNVMMIQIQE